MRLQNMTKPFVAVLLLMVILLVAWSFPYAFADVGAVECGDIWELLEALTADRGGDIYLTDDIVVPEEHLFVHVTVPVTVHMGEHCILIIGTDDLGFRITNELEVSGPVTFIGSETLFVMGEGGAATLHEEVTLIAEGENACALMLVGANSSASGYFPTLCATGSGACGVKGMEYEMWLTGLRIIADDGAVPIRSAGTLYAKYCHFENTDGGNIFVLMDDAAGGMINYSSVLLPAQADVVTPALIDAKPDGVSRYHVLQGDEDFDLDLFLPSSLEGLIMQYEELQDLPPGIEWIANEVGVLLPVDWDLSGYSALDIHVPGIYEIHGVYQAPFTALGLVFPPLTQQIIVVDPLQAWITGGDMFFDWDDNWSMDLSLMGAIEGYDALKLWCWENDGTGWSDPVDKLALGEAKYKPDGWWGPEMHVSRINAQSMYRFRLEVIGGPMECFSNYMEVEYNPYGGGDRDLGDRDPTDMPGSSPGTDPVEPYPSDVPKNDPASPMDMGAIQETPKMPSFFLNPRTTQGRMEAGGNPKAAAAQPDRSSEPAVPEQDAPAQAVSVEADVAASAEGNAGESDTRTIYTLQRQYLLDLLEANPLSTSFFFDDVHLTLDSAVLKALLGGAQFMRFETSFLDESAIGIRLWAEGNEIKSVEGGIVVVFPYAGVVPPNAECFLISETARIPATYKNGRITTTIQTSTTYEMVFEEGTPFAPLWTEASFVEPEAAEHWPDWTI